MSFIPWERKTAKATLVDKCTDIHSRSAGDKMATFWKETSSSVQISLVDSALVNMVDINR